MAQIEEKQQLPLPLGECVVRMEVISRTGKVTVLEFYDYMRFVRCHNSVWRNSPRGSVRSWALV